MTITLGNHPANTHSDPVASAVALAPPQEHVVAAPPCRRARCTASATPKCGRSTPSTSRFHAGSSPPSWAHRARASRP